MDVDGFDPWDFDDESWRYELQVMGEDFQEALKARGITRKLPERPDPPSVTAWLEDGVVGKPPFHPGDETLPALPRNVECPTCSGAGGGMLRNGDWEECDECKGRGEVPNPQIPLFKFESF